MPSLDNGLQGLWLDGKPVRRASLGGKVFYQKHDYDLDLVSDKDVISCYDHDTATLTATLTDYGEGVEGETVVFSCEDAVEPTVVDTSGTYDFGDCFIIDLSSMPNTYCYVRIGSENSQDSRIMLLSPSYYPTSNVRVYHGRVGQSYTSSRVMIKSGKLFIESSNTWEEVDDISSVDLTTWYVYNNGVTVDSYFYETGVTDSNGQCSVCYESKGAGDLNIKCECMNLQETYVVEDCKWEDNQSTDKRSDYDRTKGSVSLTYSPNQYIGISSSQGEFGGVSPPISINSANNYKISVEVLTTQTSSRKFIGFLLYLDSTHYISFLRYGDHCASYDYGNSGRLLAQQRNINTATNTWYKMSWEINNGNLRYLAYDTNNNIVMDTTIELPSMYSNQDLKPVIIKYDPNVENRYRNFKIKPL